MTEYQSMEADPLITDKTAGGGDEEAFVPKACFEDHFSLDCPSDQVRFRTNAVRVYGSGTQQFQIVESKDSLKAKVTSDGSSGLSTLRAWYALVAVLMMGFLLIFCLQVLLFLFVSLVMEGGLSSKQKLNVFHLLGAILSIPVFIYGLASALTMASEFVLDTWGGHQFFRSILRWSAVFIDWYSFFAFLGIPLGVMVFEMFHSEHFWERTALTWFVCVGVSYCLFCLGVFVLEIWGSLELLSHHPDYALIELNIKQVGKFLKRAILLRQLHTYCGVRTRTFFIEGSQALPTPNDSYDESHLADHEFSKESISWYCRFTQKLSDDWFLEYPRPKRQFNIEDVLDREVFVTDSTWSLEKLFCRRSKARTVMVVNGPSAVEDSQVVSSFLCAVIGNGFGVVVFAALLTWGGMPILGVIVLTVVLIFANRNTVIRVYNMYDSYNDVRKRRTDTHGTSETMYQVTETHRLTRPSEKLCWILFGCELFLLFVFPLWMLCDVGNRAIAVLFAILGSFSACRHYFNVPVVLTELGSLDLLEGKFIRGVAEDRDPVAVKEEDWREKNRLSKIVARISQGSRRDTWIGVIGALVIIFMFLFLSAFGGGSNSGAEADTSNLIQDFRYPGVDGIHYPTCSLTSDFAIPGSNETSLADYAYIAGIAYTAPESMPDVLDKWFGEGVAVDQNDFVMKYRESLKSDSAVHYKLITFPSNPEFAIVSIRGTNNGWDMISDAQLWSASWLAQQVRAMLPFGEIWNPILEELVEMIGVLQNDSLKKVAFYVQTSNFVKWLKDNDKFDMLRVTGHSLGGGLAMITGAQTQTPAVGLSGPNTIITRKTLFPPVTVENLDKYTFNIIPDRDPVPAIDDPAKNMQKIHCLAPANNFVDCHTSTRSLCEIQYTCGSGNRPTLCDCALYFGYPEPEPTGDRTFKEACPL
uniref:Fungal lipase-type domain-containing protein n=1 Tax=Amphora coffeiformis TaxID=265554 RepID=A0A7S3PDK4_9STRA